MEEQAINPARPGLCTVGDAAKFLAIGRARLYQLMANGELSSIKIGRSRRIVWADLYDLVERNRV
jgi:excisionase family DNA binding protein